MMAGTLVVEEEIVMSNRRVGLAWCVAAALALALPAGAAAQAAQPTKPANATGECKDGTFTTAKSKSGACSNHGGVATWYAAAAADTKAAAKEASKDTKAAAKEASKDTTAATKEASKDTKAAAKEASKDTKAAAKEASTDTKAATKEAKSTSSKAPTVARPADAPPDSTAQCNDGTFSKSTHHSGTCAGHKGVKAWFK
jgi:hypothetical protein